MDDQIIESYNSDTRQYLPKTEWMKKLEPEYWERETTYHQKAESTCKDYLQYIIERFNKTAGLHIYQEMYGCELKDDGSTAVYYKNGYNGREFMYLDTRRWMWIPVMNEAKLSTHSWNHQERKWIEEWNIYLTNTCMEQLKKVYALRPEVKVWSHHSDGVTRFQCLVYGFHPRAVDVKWVRNGEDHLPSEEMTPILPHPDGTYQIRVTADVPTTVGDTYSCHVGHSSLEEILTVIWGASQNAAEKDSCFLRGNSGFFEDSLAPISVLGNIKISGDAKPGRDWRKMSAAANEFVIAVAMEWNPNAKSKNNISIIIGICVAIVVKVIIATAIGVIACRSRYSVQKTRFSNDLVGVGDVFSSPGRTRMKYNRSEPGMVTQKTVQYIYISQKSQ
ncbi:class I histocompatibility antigen, F10 alpha chain-like [Mantella aurantiaca]